jgi:FlaG/FlaF family flagellin (archaellin)
MNPHRSGPRGTRRPNKIGGRLRASPVVGVILMVGTTIVLAATVYGWAGTYSNVPQQGVKVIGRPTGPTVRSYAVAAAMPGLSCADLNFILDGAVFALAADHGCPAPETGSVTACSDGEALRPRDNVAAGTL